MGGLTRRGFAIAAAATGIVLVLGLLAAVVRLLPWWLSRDVPFSVSTPFALALLAAALEAALVLGAPVGGALAVGIALERGELRALESLGVSPQRIARSMWPLPVALGLMVLVLDTGWDARSMRPGLFAQQLVEEAKTSCYGSDGPQALSVPLVNITWVCFKDAPPRVVAPLPGGADAWVVASDLRLSPDLRSIALRRMQIRTRPAQGRPTLDVRVDDGTIRGLPGWGRGTRMSGVQRGLTAMFVLVASVLGAAFALTRWKVASLAGVVPVGLLSPALALAVLSRLDASDLPLSLLALVPVGCAVLPSALIWPVRRFGRWFGRGAAAASLC
jgi:hypothetical protein